MKDFLLERTPPSSPEEVMKKDNLLFEKMKEEGRFIFHFYRWKSPSVTYGCFVNPEQFLHMEQIEKKGVCLAKRPTGGGLIFHPFDLAFSLHIPVGSPFYCSHLLEGYQRINKKIFSALCCEALIQEGSWFLGEDAGRHDQGYRFCMAHPTKYDFLVEGKKIIGAAQRRKAHGILHQGSISLIRPDPFFLKPLLKDQESLLPLIAQNSFYLFEREWGGLEEFKKRIEEKIVQEFIS